MNLKKQFILGSQARDTLAGDDECIDNFSLNCRPSNYVNPNNLYEYSNPASAERAIVFWNCQGLRTAYSSLCEILSSLDKKPCIVGLCETFVSSKSLPWDFSFPGYICERRERTTMERGGLGLLISEGTQYWVRDDLSLWLEGRIETLFIEIKNEGERNLILGLIYKNPSCDISFFLDEFEPLLDKINNENKNKFMMGDFNIDLLKRANSSDFVNMMVSHDSFPLVTIPTRISHLSASLIDNFFVNGGLLERSQADVVVSDGSDHLLLISKIKLNQSKENKRNERASFYREMNNKNLKSFANMMDETNFSRVIKEKCPNTAYDLFSEIVTNVMNETCPLRRINPNRNFPKKPWITKAILVSIKQKNKLYVNYLKDHSDDSFIKFKRFRNILNSVKRNAQKLYFQNEFHENQGNMKNTWKTINKLLGKFHSKEEVRVMETTGGRLTDSQDISEFLCGYFANEGKRLCDQARAKLHTSASFGSVVERQPVSQNSFEFARYSEREVARFLATMKSSSSGMDEFSLKLIKAAKTSVLPVLTHLINLSLDLGVFPEALKIARVVPLHKGGKKDDPSNRRPISILPFFSKLYEKVVHAQLSYYIEKNKILMENQFGFRKGLSTDIAVLKLVDWISDAFEAGLIPAAVFLDMKKAFDTVDHSELIQALDSIGVKGSSLEWFSSYLHNRYQIVQNGSFLSSKKKVECGVPQGSILGPLLFIIFIDRVKHYLSEAGVILFADDTLLFLAAPSLDVLYNKIHNAVSEFLTFSQQNMLTLNFSKTFFMIFSRLSSSAGNDHITVQENVIKRVATTKYLGFLIDENLSWKNHSSAIAEKLSRGLGVMRRIKNLVPKKILKMIYFSIFYPYISYGCSIWASNFVTCFKRVQKLQNRAVKLLSEFDDSDEVPAHEHFKKNKLMDVSQIRDYQVAIFSYKYLNQLLTPAFENLFTFNRDRHDHNTRKADNLTHEFRSTTRASFVIRHYGPHVWNILPECVKNAPSLPAFKSRAKKFLLSRE